MHFTMFAKRRTVHNAIIVQITIRINARSPCSSCVPPFRKSKSVFGGGSGSRSERWRVKAFKYHTYFSSGDIYYTHLNTNKTDIQIYHCFNWKFSIWLCIRGVLIVRMLCIYMFCAFDAGALAKPSKSGMLFLFVFDPFSRGCVR